MQFPAEQGICWVPTFKTIFSHAAISGFPRSHVISALTYSLIVERNEPFCNEKRIRLVGNMTIGGYGLSVWG